MFITEQRYNEVIKQCRELALSRNERYGDSINIMRTGSIIDLCLMKLIRTRKLDESDAKYTDEIKDVLNYMAYILLRKEDDKL